MEIKRHHYLIQALMWKQCCNELQMKQLIAKCINADSSRSERANETQITSEMMSDLISEVNRNIRAYNMQISRGPNETDGTLFYALINNADNDITRLSNEWTNKEILYFRKLISAIIESDHSFISSTKALNIGREESISVSITVAEKLIEKWSQHKWIEEISDGNIAIGVRSLLEMNVYIRERFEVQDCFRCKLLCIRGSNCLNCNIKMHFHCADSQFIRNNKCPECSKQWAPNEEFATNSTRNSNQVIHSTDDDSEHSEEHNCDHNEDRNSQPVRVQRAKRTKRN